MEGSARPDPENGKLTRKRKRLRGVRQRYGRSWTSEIFHPLLKKRVWLGTFESAEEAARVYDEAAILMRGSNAKTNFAAAGGVTSSWRSPAPMVKAKAKIRESYRSNGIGGARDGASASASAAPITCLKLDTQNSNLGVWRKGPGAAAPSHWLMLLHLPPPPLATAQLHALSAGRDRDQETHEMIQELLLS